MRRRIKRTIIAIAILVLTLITQEFIAQKWNIWCISHGRYTCMFCRANFHKETILWVPLPDKIQEAPFSRYYRREVDPEHKHTWRVINESACSILGAGYVRDGLPGMFLPLRLREKPTWAILRSLPNSVSRKKFMDKLYFTESYDHSKYRDVKNAVDNLR